MTCEHIVRDVTDIYIRLFNHRAAIQGLTNNFVKEFEEKRGEREILSLSRTFELVTESRDRILPSITEQLDCHLEHLKESVEKAKQQAQRILQDSEEKKRDWLESQKLSREQKWFEFMTAQVERSNSVDEEFKTKVENLHKHYSDLEEKLREGTTKVL
uniref:Biogenesis of lysosome-related organelles complex 1 subunit 5 n=1 Tax=Arion vulgaris TaxID=1028688 RepID=A0A0B6ZMJ4_9EUPU